MLTAEQIAARRLGIGGSDIASVCSLPGAFGSPMSVYLDKIGAAEAVEPNEAMYWGSKHERAILERFAEDHPEYIVQPYTGITERHPDHPFAQATPDGYVFADDGSGFASSAPDAGIECKTASAYQRDQWEGEELPIAYMAQVQWCMGVTGIQMWFVAVLIGGNTYKEYVVDFDPEFFGLLLARAEAFWRLVETRTPPPIDATPASTQVLKMLYPADAVVSDVVDLPAEVDGVGIDALVAERATLKAEAKAIDERLRLAENRLKLAIGEHAEGRTPGGAVVTYKARERRSLDAKRLAAEHPEVAGEYERVSTFRVLDVKEADDGEQG